MPTTPPSPQTMHYAVYVFAPTGSRIEVPCVRVGDGLEVAPTARLVDTTGRDWTDTEQAELLWEEAGDLADMLPVTPTGRIR